MTETQAQAGSSTRKAGLILAAVVLIGGVVFGAVQLSGGMGTTVPTGDTAKQSTDESQPVAAGLDLPKALGGQAAIDALGDDIAAAAELNGMTVEQLEYLLLTDSTVKVSKTGALMMPGPTKK